VRHGPGPLSRWLLRRLSKGGCAPTLLMYHGTPAGAEGPAPYSLHAEHFRGHVEVFRQLGWPTPCVSELVRAPAGPALCITFDDGYRDNLEHAFPLLQSAGLKATWFVPSARVGGLADWGNVPAAQAPLMSRDDLLRLIDAGMEIGAHSRTHARLPTLDEATLTDEVSGAREELEQLLGGTVSSFAYPYGLHDERTQTAVAAAGYRLACSTRAGRFDQRDGPFSVRRLTLRAGDDADALVRKLWLGSNQATRRDVALNLASRLLVRQRPSGGLLTRHR
jgi:peptidoglycan/xylan/chitin deacetylase (PgdA/CDA1 family)